MAEKTAGLSAEEREAVKQRAAELRAQEKAGKSRAAGEEAVRAGPVYVGLLLCARRMPR